MSAAWLLALVAGLWAGEAPGRSVLLVGWDGADRRRLEQLLENGKLPHLAGLIKNGAFVAARVTTGHTETKPGWAEILTGRDADAMGIEDNRTYGPIPKGVTVFERLKAEASTPVCAALVTGKSYNLGARGPHEICVNCFPRDPTLDWGETFWWDRKRNVGHTKNNLPERWVKREGEPFLHAAAVLDIYQTDLGRADKTGPAALAALKTCGDRRFFLFTHFDDPDEMGHRHGSADPRYAGGFETADAWLGRLLSALRDAGRLSSTTIYVVTDHGFDADSQNHTAAPLIWLVSSRPGYKKEGDRKDVGATLLRELGLSSEGLAGRPLQKD